MSTPQARRLERLKKSGLTQRNVLVHEVNEEAFQELRPAFSKPQMAAALSEISATLKEKTLTNVSQVRQLSPFRYPGGKTWLVPVVREWFQTMSERPRVLLEPFAGGAIVGLTAAAEGWVEQVELVELDDEIAAVWNLVIHGSDSEFERLLAGILEFSFDIDHVRALIDMSPRSDYRRALRTIVKNRAQRGGIMAPGAGLMKNGEGGKGISSRWYPETLVRRLNAIRGIRERITFIHGDAFSEIEKRAGSATALFVDPPYTAGGKNAGKRLYNHNEVDHAELFRLVSEVAGPAMLTYDDNEWVRDKSLEFGFVFASSMMQTTHLVKMHELVIIKEPF